MQLAHTFQTMINSPKDANSLVDILRLWATKKPNAEVFRFYPQGEGEYTLHSFSEFDTRCRAIASHLQVHQGKRALLLFNSGMEFLEAFFACFYAGVTAVPAYPPRRNHNLGRLQALVSDCDPSIILSADNVMALAKPICEEAFDEKANALPWLITNTVSNADASDYIDFFPEGDEIAFLQYTSGSTGKPKGVMVSHKNLMTNIRMAEKAFALPPLARCVSWLPLYHDMGLIGAVMTPIYWGSGSILMPPAAFLQKPLRWLKLIDELGKKTPIGSLNPNFCYQLCVDTISDEDAKTLDLSPWIFALNAAEPVRSSTVEAFFDKFGPAGFTREALSPSFGMAECTVMATCRQKGDELVTKRVSGHKIAENLFEEKADGSRVFVSSGTNCTPQTLRIVNPESLDVLSENHIGEIWLAGDHIAQGYWGLPELSGNTFQAFTADGQGPFLRTGDLGTLSDGQLFVTGRLKDLLIIRGRNHYPQDIEFTASNAHTSLHLDNAAAFTIDIDNQEKLVIVQEVQRTAMKSFDAESCAQLIRNAVAREHGIETFAIAFIRFASIPKTTSGKIQRSACQQLFTDKAFTLIGEWQASNSNNLALPVQPQQSPTEISQPELEAWIQQWLAAKAKVSVNDIPVDAAIDGLGLDSVDLVQLTGELSTWLQQPIDHVLVWEQPHIRALASALLQLANTAPAENTDDEIDGVI
jgi:acyl-CoA synthetase (AMP-forming)/AMP-acid ligase II/acyl carrier protein